MGASSGVGSPPDRAARAARAVVAGVNAGVTAFIDALRDRSDAVTPEPEAIAAPGPRHSSGSSSPGAPVWEHLLELARAAEAGDTNPVAHLARLELTSARLALAAGLPERAATEIGRAAMLHDIGKLRVPDTILLKPNPLDPEEWLVVRNHPIWSEEALRGPDLELAREIARSHHENWNGSGYPDGLYGDRIPFAARVVRITDAFDAMTNERPYQLPISFEAAQEELQENAAIHFDPTLVRVFVELVRSDPALRQRLVELRTISAV